MHQHWVDQCESAGGFNVFDTEAPEGFHKTVMSLSANRVRHYGVETQNSMRNYLLHHLLFTNLKELLFPVEVHDRPPKLGIHKCLTGSTAVPVFMGIAMASVANQTAVLHPEARVTRVELMDMVCTEVGLPLRLSSYTLLGSLEWNFGQKLVTRDQVYWATDTQYSTCVSKSGPRRDTVLLHGTEKVDVTLPTGQVVERDTALCCQLVCFLSLGNMKSLQHLKLPQDVTEDIIDDVLTLVLVRWFSPHPTCTLRDSCGMPLCPPPLDINHALWEYAKTPNVRTILWTDDGTPTQDFVRQAHMFGNTKGRQMLRHESESHAYYGLIRLSSIKCRTHMTPEFELHTVNESNTWLQTITLA